MIFEVLDERKRKVLRIIVEDYIDSAEPVGSKAVTQKHRLAASPATIRFDMADLEKHGYIKKPHTSAGRIPSDKGYRFFLDNLMKIYELTQKEQDIIEEKIRNADKEDLLQIVGDILSNLCGNASIVVSGDRHKNVYVSGISKMLRQPEFGFMGRTCDILEVMEQHSRIIDILDEYLADKEDISVHIGGENPVKALKECAVAAVPYNESGMLSIIGPTRMHYEKVSSVLRGMAEILEEIDL